MLRTAATRLARPLQARGMATQAKLPDLPYGYADLSPIIIPEIMELHHKKHHQAYVTNYNSAVEQYSEAEHKNDISKMIQLQPALKFNGGGHINHSLFWQMLTPPKEWEPPSGALEEAINTEFGDLDGLIKQFNATTGTVQGSGWGWLGYDPAVKLMRIVTTPNQDPLQPTTGLVPLLGIDVWEHAFYLQYKNARPDYLKEVWKVVNWRDVGQRYKAATGQ